MFSNGRLQTVVAIFITVYSQIHNPGRNAVSLYIFSVVQDMKPGNATAQNTSSAR